MSEAALRDARRALARLGRSVEKARRELAAVGAALREAEGDDFPAPSHDSADGHLLSVQLFVDEEGDRLSEKILAGEVRIGNVPDGGVRRRRRERGG